jgi:hypothetical protein
MFLVTAVITSRSTSKTSTPVLFLLAWKENSWRGMWTKDEDQSDTGTLMVQEFVPNIVTTTWGLCCKETDEQGEADSKPQVATNRLVSSSKSRNGGKDAPRIDFACPSTWQGSSFSKRRGNGQQFLYTWSTTYDRLPFWLTGRKSIWSYVGHIFINSIF